MATLATIDEVRNAGNFSEKTDTSVLTFYLNLSSYFLIDLLTQNTYDKAIAGSLPDNDNAKLKLAEALLTVGFALPAIASKIAETGALRTIAVGGRGSELEIMSFAKEIMALAANFANLAHFMIPKAYLANPRYKQIWYEVIMRMFPSLDEMPTVATMHSWAEGALQDARVDKLYDPTTDG